MLFNEIILNSAQKRYTTTERELLSIVETLKEYRNILLGQRLKVYTDHKNLTYSQFNSNRVHRWRLFLEEFGVNLRYIKGKANVAADALSRLAIDEAQSIKDIPFAHLYATEVAEDDSNDTFPMIWEELSTAQQSDPALMEEFRNSRSQRFEKRRPHESATIELIHHRNKIVVPQRLQNPVILASI